MTNKKSKVKKLEVKTYVNLGCGVAVLPDEKGIHWINIDKFTGEQLNAKNFIQGDIIDIPLDKEVADYIICDQVMEHLRMDDVIGALHEIRRILKKGGKAVIIVPDFRSAVNDWLAFDWELNFNALQYQFLSEVIFGNQNHEGEYHRTPFSAGYFHYVLNMAGLREHVLQLHPKGGVIPDFPGIYAINENARLRNSQLVAIITK